MALLQIGGRLAERCNFILIGGTRAGKSPHAVAGPAFVGEALAHGLAPELSQLAESRIAALS